MGWSAQSLQFVLFCPPMVGASDALQPWSKLFHISPNNFQQSPPGFPQAQSTAMGLIGDFNVTIGAMPGRFDLILGPPADGPNSGPPLLGEPFQALSVLVEHAKKFLEFQPAMRLAIVANLVESAADQHSANKRFTELTGGIDVPEIASDLSLQINVPVEKASLGLRLNRLCRWQSQQVQLVTFMFNVDGASHTPIQSATQAYNVGLSIDINTVPTPATFDKSKAIDILNELADEIKKISLGGYEHLVA